ncbi:MAG: hypothetical protein ACRDZT_01585, partial [Acidimicrobiales bacterium]
PRAIVRHESRLAPRPWARRRVEYGTSAAALSRLHPRRLAPARVSSWNLASICLVASGSPCSALGTTAVATILLHRRLRSLGLGPSVALSTVARGLVADSAAIGHTLRREWWPIGAAALVASRHSRVARCGAVLMVAPLLLEWGRQRGDLDVLSYSGLRLVDDALYGTGVAVGSWKARTIAPLVPEVAIPEGLRRLGSRLRAQLGRTCSAQRRCTSS